MGRLETGRHQRGGCNSDAKETCAGSQPTSRPWRKSMSEGVSVRSTMALCDVRGRAEGGETRRDSLRTRTFAMRPDVDFDLTLTLTLTLTWRTDVASWDQNVHFMNIRPVTRCGHVSSTRGLLEDGGGRTAVRNDRSPTCKRPSSPNKPAPVVPGRSPGLFVLPPSVFSIHDISQQSHWHAITPRAPCMACDHTSVLAVPCFPFVAVETQSKRAKMRS